MLNWYRLICELGLDRNCEAACHPHVPEERADLFHAADGGSTEFEYLNLLHALILATKPRRVLETGTSRGFGTLAIAAALEYNGVGRLTTVDVLDCSEARALASTFQLAAHVDFIQGNAVEFCQSYGGAPFDVAFFDSEVSIRHIECEALVRRGKLHGGALAIFHDASAVRSGNVPISVDLIKYLRRLKPSIEFPLSRGLWVWQVAGAPQ